MYPPENCRKKYVSTELCAALWFTHWLQLLLVIPRHIDLGLPTFKFQSYLISMWGIVAGWVRGSWRGEKTIQILRKFWSGAQHPIALFRSCGSLFSLVTPHVSRIWPHLPVILTDVTHKCQGCVALPYPAGCLAERTIVNQYSKNATGIQVNTVR
jgi:hypothetical protein